MHIDYIVIPARGGSKRIKGKNLRHFLGKSMLTRSIELAKTVSNNVIVSSDHTDILQVAKHMGVIAKLRNNELSNDYATTLDVMRHVLLSMDSNIREDSVVLCLYPTAMFATKDYIYSALQKLVDSNDIAYMVPVVRQDKVLRSFMLKQDRIDFLFKEFVSSRTQDLPSCFCDSGQFYLGYAKSFINGIPILGEKSATIELAYAHDIDNECDLAIAQALFSFIHGNNRA